MALDDARLRRSLIPRLQAIDPDLNLAKEGYFRMPPAGDPQDRHLSVGVRALEFPRWFVCQGCRRLARAGDQFENKGGRYRHECAKNKSAMAVPARFVGACKRGHITDFPWAAFAHLNREGGQCDRPELYLWEKSSGDIARISVECKNCHAPAATMNRAMNLGYKCSGDRPWLGGRAANEACDQALELLVRTATHAYFPQVVSALRLPDPEPDPLRMKLRAPDLWKSVQNVTALEELTMLVKLMPHVAAASEGHAHDKVLAAIKSEKEAGAAVADRPLRSAERAGSGPAVVEHARQVCGGRRGASLRFERQLHPARTGAKHREDPSFASFLAAQWMGLVDGGLAAEYAAGP